MCGFELQIFWALAVIVIETSQPNGKSVTQAKRLLPILITIVVHTQSAMVAKSWFEIPNRGHRLLMPPSGSSTPWIRKYPQAADHRARDEYPGVPACPADG